MRGRAGAARRAGWCAALLALAGCGGASGSEPGGLAGPSGGGAAAVGGVDFRALGWTGPVLDQSFVGACAAFSVTAVMNAKLRVQGVTEGVSPMHVWAEMKHRQGISENMINVAVAPASAWAYDPVKACLIAAPGDPCAQAGFTPGSGQLDPSINLEWMRANLAERHRVIGVDLVYSRYDAALADKEQIFRALAAGEPLDAVVLVGDAFYAARPVLEDYDVGENNPGHGVALVGFRYAAGGREVLIQNSWGTSWGEGGFAWMPERMIGRQLTSAARFTMIDARAPIPPGNNCDDFHQRDLVLDACYATCRSYVPPINGRCNPLPRNEHTQLSCLDPREVLSGRCRLPWQDGATPAIPALPWPF